MSAPSEKQINQNVDKTAEETKRELNKLRVEYEELKRQAKPKVQEAESLLTSPSAIGFYQGLIVGVCVVLGYAKYKGGLVV
ncbi:hypothetical protein EDC96DRAFT_454632 [Choanephora cucurbitarum]|uniref:Uncharacterized protein n=1 Tax=Choanephora cucurbitarum TaxID=101091 RepID=A0A1C7NAA1_9FUNG|nr:hypothetical protein BD560DRAFT_351494 [Blakeslea trispora]KAI8379866.1 hypothetical protein EDC96DRAFT_454632 [Choanephora cucurbitarum]OBZ84284.1 hypothetical protein A0J61_07672 [Choanephora cucurbitarum]